MATLTDSTNLTATITLTKASGTKVTLDTDKKYITKDIELTLNAQTATPSFTGGGVSGTATASATNATISNSTNNSGVYIEAAATASRAEITYNGAVSGWVEKSNGASAFGATNPTVLSGNTYYINGVTINTPSSGTRTFSVTVPNGATTATFVFNVASNGTVTITES